MVWRGLFSGVVGVAVLVVAATGVAVIGAITLLFGAIVGSALVRALGDGLDALTDTAR